MTPLLPNLTSLFITSNLKKKKFIEAGVSGLLFFILLPLLCFFFIVYSYINTLVHKYPWVKRPRTWIIAKDIIFDTGLGGGKYDYN